MLSPFPGFPVRLRTMLNKHESPVSEGIILIRGMLKLVHRERQVRNLIKLKLMDRMALQKW